MGLQGASVKLNRVYLTLVLLCHHRQLCRLWFFYEIWHWRGQAGNGKGLGTGPVGHRMNDLSFSMLRGYSKDNSIEEWNAFSYKADAGPIFLLIISGLWYVIKNNTNTSTLFSHGNTLSTITVFNTQTIHIFDLLMFSNIFNLCFFWREYKRPIDLRECVSGCLQLVSLIMCVNVCLDRLLQSSMTGNKL